MNPNEKRLTEEEEIAALFPQPVEMRVGATLRIYVKTLDTESCFALMHKARPIFKRFVELEVAADSPDARFKRLMLVAEEFPDELFEALAIVTERPAEFLRKLPFGVATAIAYIAWELNVDFFVQTVGALASGVLEMVREKAAADGAGQTH